MANPASKTYQLLSMLQSYAPNGTAQNDCTRLLHELEGDELTERQIVRALAAWLLDGLDHGNWPWIGWSGATKSRNVESGA